MRRSVAVLSTLLLCAANAVISSAQTLTTLVNFNSTTGTFPLAPVVQGSDGDFYGTTEFGGANNKGTVFKMASDGTLTTLYSFCALANCADGARPFAGLVQGTDGNFYGTTYSGGASLRGTIFKITPQGTMTKLHDFAGTEGEQPYAGLVQATDGDFYGTTVGGGNKGSGTVFKLKPDGTFTSLYSFCSQTQCTDGTGPTAGLVQGSDGSFYGMTTTGGPSSGGTVFRITSAGALTTLHSFSGPDGANPYRDGLVLARDGTFYGTTKSGGANSLGTVFKMTPDGALTTLYSFNGTDGQGPEGSLVQATDGKLYGTTTLGGTGTACLGGGCGTIFSITTDGTLSTLHNFNLSDGADVDAGLIQAADGRFYGTTSDGGTGPMGTVFRFDAGVPANTLLVTTTGSGTVLSGDGFIHCGAICMFTYTLGTPVLLTAIPGVGSTLSGWTGCDSMQANRCTVTMSGSRTVTAGFQTVPVTLQSLTFKPSTVAPGRTAIGTLTLAGAAPSGGVSVGLMSSAPSVASVPKSIYIPGNAVSARFVAKTYRTHTKTDVTVTAVAGDSSTMGVLTVDPHTRWSGEPQAAK